MPRLFAVTRSRTAAWDWSRPIEEQTDWRLHAEFMDALHADGFALLVGPFEDTGEALLIVRASDPDEIRRRLDADPWSHRLLQTTRIAAWTLRLGSLD